MRALYFEQGQAHLRHDVEFPRPASGECRIEILCAGVCATDLALLAGYMDFEGVPGHEFVGRALDGPLAGRRVVGDINAACGECATCSAGQEHHCPQRSVLGILGRSGAFAEQIVLPIRNLLPVPDAVSDAAATFTEPLAAAFEILEQVQPAAGERALVIGDGRLGLLCSQVLALAGLEVSLLGRHPDRRQSLGLDLEWLDSDMACAAPKFDLVVEASGGPQMLEQALERVRPRGTVVLKTTTERPYQLDLAPLVVNEIRLIGSRCGPFAPALQALADERVRVEPMIQGRFSLEQGAEALERAAEPGVLKILIEP